MARWDAAWHRRLNEILVNIPFTDDATASETRRELGKDPVAFARIYLSHHLQGRESGSRISFCEVHYDWARMGESWKTLPSQPMEDRKAFVAPRGIGKSTWWFLILPVWAAAYGHSKFAAAFANSTTQAEGHLQTMKTELDTNALLQADFPALCTPLRRPTGATVADRQGMLHQRNGFVFAARGVDAASLGMKVGERRPDLLILDDIEPEEAKYSPALAVKRLGTMTDGIFPLNIYARVVMVGTVTMPGSIMHQLVKSANGVETDEWVADEKIQAHHYRPILRNDDGTERSIWPEKWPLAWLNSRRHTREYAKNYENDPMAREGVYWRKEDFEYADTLPGITRTMLQVDPAITTKKSSDFTGLAVVSWVPPSRHEIANWRNDCMIAIAHRERTPEKPTGKCLIKHAVGVRLTGKYLRDYVIELLGIFPEIRAVRVETNQGGDLWLDVFHDLPRVKILTNTATESKEIRFADGLDYWQRRKVLHRDRFPVLEEQAVAFPNSAYDDVIDAAVAGVLFFLAPEKKIKVAAATHSYV